MAFMAEPGFVQQYRLYRKAFDDALGRISMQAHQAPEGERVWTKADAIAMTLRWLAGDSYGHDLRARYSLISCSTADQQSVHSTEFSGLLLMP